MIGEFSLLHIPNTYILYMYMLEGYLQFVVTMDWLRTDHTIGQKALSDQTGHSNELVVFGPSINVYHHCTV